MDDVVSDSEICRFAPNISPTGLTSFAFTYLDMSFRDIDNVTFGIRNNIEKSYKVLRKWRDLVGFQATPGRLRNAVETAVEDSVLPSSALLEFDKIFAARN